jgi:hypothetical protein
LINIKINGQPLQVEEGTNIFKAAKKIGGQAKKSRPFYIHFQFTSTASAGTHRRALAAFY